ncbi:MAG: DUF370 domain-containing protein [Thermodesulfobacteriota bacterium]|nr:DUF370 domain-containing protein [Thermodesulfobacteriota bacterium]
MTHYTMSQELINIGFGNLIAAQRITAIIAPHSAPVKRLKDDARKEGRLVDATQGRRTRSVIVMDSQHIILSAVNVETISRRFGALQGQE